MLAFGVASAPVQMALNTWSVTTWTCAAVSLVLAALLGSVSRSWAIGRAEG